VGHESGIGVGARGSDGVGRAETGAPGRAGEKECSGPRWERGRRDKDRREEPKLKFCSCPRVLFRWGLMFLRDQSG
jgi:hypothetical protein